MDLTKQRIAMLNKVHGEKVSLLVVDKEQVGITGTEIILKIKLDRDDE
jgi:hypothetical protein